MTLGITEDDKQKLWELIEPIKVGMLASWNGDFLHSRPMHHANENFGGELLYFTDIHSHKIDELQQYPDFNIS